MSVYSEMLEKLKKGSIEEVIYQNDNEEYLYQLSDMRKNLLVWYDFREDASVLEIGGECGAITGLLCDKVQNVTSFVEDEEKAEINRFINKDRSNLEIVTGDINQIEDRYDYIVLAGSLEIAPQIIDSENPYKDLLRFAKNHLNDEGIILLATNNRLGARYFAGAPESHVNKYFTGLNDYKGIDTAKTFSKNELKDLYISVGLFNKSFYYPYPDYRFTTEVFTDKTINSGLYGRPYPNFDKKYIDLIDENKLLQDYAKEGVAGTFANSFLIELTYGKNHKKKNNIEYVKISSDRKKEFRIYTSIWSDETGKKVSKYALDKDGADHVNAMKDISFEGDKYSKLKDSSDKSGVLTYDYLSVPSLDKKAADSIMKGDGKAVEEIFDMIKNVFMPEETLKRKNPADDPHFTEVFGESEEDSYKCIKNMCFDLILDNIFEVDGKLMIIDYEWFFDFYVPSEYIMWRSINELYYKYPDLYYILDRTRLLQKYRVTQEKERNFRKWEAHFLKDYVGGERNKDKVVSKLTFDIDDEARSLLSPVSDIYFDFGDGFSEGNKKEIELSVSNDGHFSFDLDLKGYEGIAGLRWDPSRVPCVCSDLVIKVNGTKVNYKCINCNEDNSSLFFYSDDGNIIISDEIDKYESFSVEGYIRSLSKESLYSKLQLSDKRQTLAYDNQRAVALSELENQKNEELMLKEKELIAYRNYLNSIRRSKLWNLYKLKRGLKKTVKKLIGKEPVKVQTNEYNIKSAVERFVYEDNVIDIQGWIFDPTHEIKELYFVIEKEGIFYQEEITKGAIRREDIKIAYDHPAAYESGFSERYNLRFSGKAEACIRVVFENDESYLKLGSLVGKNSFDGVSLSKYEKIPDGGSLNGRGLIPEEDKDSNYKIDRTIDLIIPVYNGYDYLDKLLRDIKKTNVKTNIIIVEDKSPDERVLPLLEKYRDSNKNVTLICNETNMGFVKSVNKGLAYSENHAVLVNTDVELPQGWLERLMYPIVKYDNVATTTPFANSATIFSFPEFAKNNPIYLNLSVDEIDKHFRRYAPRYTVVPTGMGFLMGMNRNVINEIGLLDEESFGKGYGEENDWCQRATKKNYYNVTVENLFAYHKHGGSFLSEEKQRLIEENSRTLEEKHPDYFSDVARFCELNPLQIYREIIKNNIDHEYKKNTIRLAFNHDLGGGADIYLKQRIVEWNNQDDSTFEVRYRISDNKYQINIKDKLLLINTFEELLEILDRLKVDEVIINELVTYPHLFSKLDVISDYAKTHKAKLIMLMHDYFAVSPTINLISTQNYKYKYDGRYFECDKYYETDGYDVQYECDSIDIWRARWDAFLKKCTEVRAFSKDTINILSDIYPELSNVTYVPHKVEYMIEVKRKRKLTDTINVGLLGILSRHKGKDVVEQIRSKLKADGSNIRFVLVGLNDENDPAPLEEDDYFRITGRYHVEDLPRIVLENDIDMFLIPSIWPETFSYTTEEIMKMKLPVACFDIGAPAERVKKYDKGLILESMDPDYVIRQLKDFADRLDVFRDRRDESRKVLCIAEYISFSSRYRMEHFREQMILEGIESRYVSADDLGDLMDEELAEYSHIYIYRCRYKDKLKVFLERVKGKKIIYDIDDYIYDYDKIKDLKFLKDEEYKGFDDYSAQIRECMQKCDIITTSTKTLSDVISSDFPEKKVIINRNVASMAMFILSKKAVITDEQHEGIILGYFSGSKTHNDDFKLIENQILDMLEEKENIKLLVVGVLELSERFDKYQDRIIKKDFVDWRQLPQLLRSVDINLMPLTYSFFNSCKSENKWTEAALVKRPTVASFNDEIYKVTKDHKNIIISGENDGWNVAIQEAAINGEKIADEAYRYVLYNKLTSTSSEIVDEILK